MKKIISLIFVLLISFSLLAQVTVAEKNLGKTLEKNKDAAAIFVSEMNLSRIQVADDGTIALPLFVKNKIKIVSAMDMTNIAERIAFANKSLAATFEVKDLAAKTYAITKIEGLETVEQYRERCIEEQKAESRKNLSKYPVQVVNQEAVNLAGAESTWLPGQIQDKLKSNLQEYLGMKTVVDLKSEKALLQIQKQRESLSHDENSSIEIGKITTAKFALFTKLQKTAGGYVIIADFTDLTTGEQMASATSKEYSKAEYLFGSTGAVDEITLAIGNKLGLNLSEVTKNLLASGSASFSVDEQLALAKKNEAQFQKMMNDYDAELSKLMTSNDINAVQNKKKLEAEKALLIEKQNAERKRQEELNVQKERVAADAKLEAERSIALKTQRDQMAKDAAAKAAEVRKLKMEKQGVLGQINVIESKKKALVEIRKGVEVRSLELYAQLEKDRAGEEERIRNKSYSTVELGGDGNPTEQARQRRENQIIKSNEDLTSKFFSDAAAVKASTQSQDAALLAEIRADQKALAATRTVSSMGGELTVNFGKYEGSQNGWNAYLSLYSDGVLLYNDNFIVNYEALSGKKAPDMAKELNDAVIEEYTKNVDMYDSLLTRGDPIIYFEIDYNVTAEGDDKPSQYKFNFNKIRVINTVSGKITQTSSLSKIQPRTMKPEWDLREFAGVVENTKALFDPEKYPVEVYMVKGQDFISANKSAARDIEVAKLFNSLGIKMVKIPNKNFKMLSTEVTQKLYAAIMGENPSYFKGDSNPVECVNWLDAIYFCNKLSEKYGFTSVYSLDGTTDVTKWEYTLQQVGKPGKITQNTNADGFRLPSGEEWDYAARGGLADYYSYYMYYSRNDNLDEVGWFSGNSREMTHPVAQKKPNDYGLYDMYGNVSEWVWDYIGYDDYRYLRGSGYDDDGNRDVGFRYDYYASHRSRRLGFRIVCSASN
ncbi:MAG: SUMF1/EgtB/PvdO family nonheme iron enzyme [Treponema sp.]|nr:SUMF1/EgtB/PvdO family nonheme iron enzyme [Candidatus Treponema equifaecale]